MSAGSSASNSSSSERSSSERSSSERAPFFPKSITRPIPALMTYFTIVAAASIIAFPFVFTFLYFRYHTMRYAFDAKGVSMSWGILFKREIYLTFGRIQDIHVSRNFVQRWLGLASVAVQTASGSSGAEMTIQGVEDPEALRDYLYAQMRGARDGATGEDDPDGSGDMEDEAIALLVDIRDGLRALGLSGGRGSGGRGDAGTDR